MKKSYIVRLTDDERAACASASPSSANGLELLEITGTISAFGLGW